MAIPPVNREALFQLLPISIATFLRGLPHGLAGRGKARSTRALPRRAPITSVKQ